MKKKKKNNKRKKILLLLLLLLLGTMLGTETYAWFTVNRLVSIDTLNVKIASKGGISISADATEWKAMVDSNDLNNAPMNYPGSINQLPDTLEPVSTGGVVDTSNGFMKMFYGNAEGNKTGDYILKTERNIEQRGNEGKFVAFDVFFKIDQASPLYMTPESKVIYTGESNPGIENAIRLAFVYQGTYRTGTPLLTIQSLQGATDNEIYIWEPNYDMHTPTGISNAREVYGINVNQSGNSIISYDGVIDDIVEEDDILISNATSANFPSKFKKVNISIPTIANYTENQKIRDLDAGISKFRIYMWIEGQDVDCENAASIGGIQFNFQFTVNP